MKSRYASDRGLTARMTGTMFLLGLLYVVFIAVLIAIGLNAAFVLVLAVGLLFAQWFFSDSIALHSMGAREVTPEQAPQLHGIVDRLCAMAEMPKPRVAIADVDMPNAFATGRSPHRSVVCVTTGLLRRLDEQELEGVLSHELSHVAHRDVLVMTIASVAGVAAGFLTRMALWGGMGRRDQNTALVSLAIIAVSAFTRAPEASARPLKKSSNHCAGFSIDDVCPRSPCIKPRTARLRSNIFIASSPPDRHMWCLPRRPGAQRCGSWRGPSPSRARSARRRTPSTCLC